MNRLHLGCGARLVPGWINIDSVLDPAVSMDLIGTFMPLDLRERLPFDDGSVSLIYCEHFLEHLTRHEAWQLLRECRRTMAPGAVMRISVPSLERLLEAYREKELCFAQQVGWLPASPCQLLNEGMRSWDHKFIYDQDELHRVLGEAGFHEVRHCAPGHTLVPDMLTEGRPYLGELIVEVMR